MAAAGKAPSCNLAQAELAADASYLFALPFAIAQHQLISGRRIPPRAFGAEAFGGLRGERMSRCSREEKTRFSAVER
jgi:hypothetical protein